MSNEIGAVITGGDFQALAVLRSLAKRGIPVIMLDNEHCISKYSIYKKKFFKAPPLSEHELYLNFLRDLAKKENIKGWIIIPNSDAAVHVLSKYKPILEEYYRIPTPDWNVIQNVYIKKNTYQLAEKNGIPIPETFYPASLEELLEMNLQFPLVIKPSIRDNFYSKVKTKAFLINDQKELIKTYQQVSLVIDKSEILVQEFITGGPNQLYSCCPFFKDGKILTSITAKRSRQHPMDFGHASTFVELVDIPEIAQIAEKFLRSIGYYGFGEVEFMYDINSGQYKLIEVNPRVWGWHSIAIAAGADFPYFLYQDMTEGKFEIPSLLKSLKWVRLTTDTATVIIEILKRKMKIRDYLSSMRGEKVFAVFAFDDPLPFFAELAMLPYLYIRRGF